MKEWHCESCGSRRRTDDDIVMKICKACQVEMKFICFVCDETPVGKIEVFASDLDGEKYNYWFCAKHLKEYEVKNGKS